MCPGNSNPCVTKLELIVNTIINRPFFINIVRLSYPFFFFFLSTHSIAQCCTLPYRKVVGRALFVSLVSPRSSLFPHDSLQLPVWWHGSSPPTYFLSLFWCLLSSHLSLQATFLCCTWFPSVSIYSVLFSCHVSCLLDASTLLFT